MKDKKAAAAARPEAPAGAGPGVQLIGAVMHPP